MNSRGISAVKSVKVLYKIRMDSICEESVDEYGKSCIPLEMHHPRGTNEPYMKSRLHDTVFSYWHFHATKGFTAVENHDRHRETCDGLCLLAMPLDP